MAKGLEFLSYEVMLNLKKEKPGARGGSCWCVNIYFTGKDGGRHFLMKGQEAVDTDWNTGNSL